MQIKLADWLSNLSLNQSESSISTKVFFFNMAPVAHRVSWLFLFHLYLHYLTQIVHTNSMNINETKSTVHGDGDTFKDQTNKQTVTYASELILFWFF